MPKGRQSGGWILVLVGPTFNYIPISSTIIVIVIITTTIITVITIVINNQKVCKFVTK